MTLIAGSHRFISHDQMVSWRGRNLEVLVYYIHEDIEVAEPSKGATLTFLKSKVGFLNDRVKPN